LRRSRALAAASPESDMDRLLILLLVKVAAAASIASILSRSGRFLGLLMRDTRSIAENLQLCLTLSVLCAMGSLVRLHSTYSAADICFEAALVCGIVGGYVSGLVGGIICALPATLTGEYLAMPLYAAVGVLGGLLRDLAPDADDVWSFSPFFDLSLWRLVRHKEHRARSVYHLGMLLALMAAESMRYLCLQGFDKKLVFTLYQKQSDLATVGAVCITTIFTVSVPLKIWNSARNERLLEAKERLLVQARLAALATQINPHFLFNTLNTVSSLIRTNPDKARQVVYRLSSILRRLLSKGDNFAPLRDEVAFIEDYLSIEIARFGDKLRFSKQIDEAAMDRLVPTMILQPLIENSIKHGLAGKVDGGSIRLSGRIRDDDDQKRLQLVVEDDGVGIEEERLATILEQAGIGVSNVNERLQVLFGSSYRLEVFSKPGAGTRTEIEIPA
jgi:two-component system LytT family sensor kinase